MNAAQIRPRFRKTVSLSPETVLSKLSASLNNGMPGTVVSHHVIIKIPDRDQHFWSPHLHLEVEAHEEGSLIRGLFGPKPGVWTMFVFGYTVIGLLALGSLIYGMSQMTIGTPPVAFLGLVLAGGMYLITWLVARAGQRLGKDQMNMLQSFLEQTLRN